MWEAASRSTRAEKSGLDAVAILAVIETEPRSTVLIEQFRPPAGGVCIGASCLDTSVNHTDDSHRDV